jgi:hypothetical protein
MIASRESEDGDVSLADLAGRKIDPDPAGRGLGLIP